MWAQNSFPEFLFCFVWGFHHSLFAPKRWTVIQYYRCKTSRSFSCTFSDFLSTLCLCFQWSVNLWDKVFSPSTQQQAKWKNRNAGGKEGGKERELQVNKGKMDLRRPLTKELENLRQRKARKVEILGALLSCPVLDLTEATGRHENEGL